MKWFFNKISKQVFSADGADLEYHEASKDCTEIDEDTALMLEELPPSERTLEDEEPAEKPLKKMSVLELKALAAERGIDLGEATKKADIIAKLTPSE